MKTFFRTIILSFLTVFFVNSVSFSQSVVNEHSIKFLNEQEATLVGEDGVILKTIDGGVSWTDQSSGITNVLYGNAIVDQNVSFAAGENGIILKTIDNGANWVIAESGTLEHLKKIAVKNSSVIICGEHGAIVVSHDMGNTWIKQTAVTNNNLNYVISAGQSIFVVGENSTIFKSTDEGDSWTQIQYSGSSVVFESIAAIDENNFTIVGDGNTIITTTDGGITWSGSRPFTPGAANLREITFFNATDGVIVGDMGVILNTSDAGATWQASNVEISTASVTPKNLLSVAFSTLLNGISIGETGAHFYTVDGGKTWTMQPSGVVNRNRPAKKNTKVVLNQNFPNPFNPSTVISYNLPFDASVSLRVYDMLGKEVNSLASGYQTAGNYNFRFDASNLSSGIYFYVLRVTGNNAGFSKTMRMILTK